MASKGCTEEAIHDFRVSARRLLATLSLLQKLSPEMKVNRLRKRVKKQLHFLGPLRDLQIRVLQSKELCRSFPGLDFFLQRSLKEEKKGAKQAEKELRRVKIKKTARLFLNAEIRILALLERRDLHQELLSSVEKIGNSAFQRAASLAGKLSQDDPESVHKLRIAFKRFRYTAELLQPLDFGITGEKLEKMQAFQQKMGEIQDLKIFRNDLKILKTGNKGRKIALREAGRQVKKLLLEKTRAFVESADEISSFKLEKQEPARLVAV